MGNYSILDSDCELAYELHHDPNNLLPVVLHVFASVGAIIAFTIYLSDTGIRKSVRLLNFNLKLLITIGIFYYTIGLTQALVHYSYKTVIMTLKLPPCFYVWNGMSCFFSFNYFTAISPTGYFLLHVCLLLERIFTKFICRRQMYVVPFGLILAAVMIGWPNYYTFGTTLRNNEIVDRLYCHTQVVSTAKVNTRTMNKNMIMLCIDLIVTSCDFILLYFNKRQVARYYKDSANYSLNRTFEFRELHISICLIAPFSIFHSFSYIIQQSFYLFVVANSQNMSFEMDIVWREYANLARTLSLFIMALGLTIYTKQQKKEISEWVRRDDVTQKHFELFKKMIS